MKKITFVLGLLVTLQSMGQYVYQKDAISDGVLMYTSIELIQKENDLNFMGTTFLPYDADHSMIYYISLINHAADDFVPDSNDLVRFVFSDGSFLEYNRMPQTSITQISKDSIDYFFFEVSYSVLEKLSTTSLNTIRLTTGGKDQSYELSEQQALTFSRIAYIYNSISWDEYFAMMRSQKLLEPNHMTFDADVNKTIDKKWIGKYKGEWISGTNRADFELNIGRDTSYFIWKNNRYENDDSSRNMNIPQTVCIDRSVVDDQIICTVCFDEKYRNRTNGIRRFTLTLSSDGKLIYGKSEFVGQRMGELYANKIK